MTFWSPPPPSLNTSVHGCWFKASRHLAVLNSKHRSKGYVWAFRCGITLHFWRFSVDRTGHWTSSLQTFCRKNKNNNNTSLSLKKCCGSVPKLGHVVSVGMASDCSSTGQQLWMLGYWQRKSGAPVFSKLLVKMILLTSGEMSAQLAGIEN